MASFIYHQPFGNNNLSSFPAQYRIAVTNNVFDIIEGRLVFYKPVPTTSDQICHIVVHISLGHVNFLFYTLSQLLVVWGSTKPSIALDYDSFGL